MPVRQPHEIYLSQLPFEVYSRHAPEDHWVEHQKDTLSKHAIHQSGLQIDYATSHLLVKKPRSEVKYKEGHKGQQKYENKRTYIQAQVVVALDSRGILSGKKLSWILMQQGD